MAIPYVFVSHASDDKTRLKPLIEALALQGLSVWIDRPGPGRDSFGFDAEFIERFRIRGLRTGLEWHEQISDAIREAGAVLVCFSRAAGWQRQVLPQELLLGQYQRKLVACIVDDLPVTALPGDLGLPDARRVQAERLDLESLARAVALERAGPRGALAADHCAREQWQLVERLTSEIDRLFEAAGGRPATAEQLAAARRALSAVPIAPMVRLFEIPSDLIAVLADRIGEPDRAAALVARAMELRAACNPEGFTERQIVLRPGELVNPRSVSPEEYWSVALSMAGLKSRRTLAALLLVPGAPSMESLPPDQAARITAFLQWLEEPHTSTSKEACAP